MTVIVDLPNEMLKKLKALAKAQGQDPAKLAASMLEAQIKASNAPLSTEQELDDAKLYPLQGTTPYSFEDPFTPAFDDDEWEGS